MPTILANTVETNLLYTTFSLTTLPLTPISMLFRTISVDCIAYSVSFSGLSQDVLARIVLEEKSPVDVRKFRYWLCRPS